MSSIRWMVSMWLRLVRRICCWNKYHWCFVMVNFVWTRIPVNCRRSHWQRISMRRVWIWPRNCRPVWIYANSWTHGKYARSWTQWTVGLHWAMRLSPIWTFQLVINPNYFQRMRNIQWQLSVFSDKGVPIDRSCGESFRSWIGAAHWGYQLFIWLLCIVAG